MEQREKFILIADDIELNRAILHDMFVQTYRILEAENGEQALQLVELYHDKIECVLLDSVMPVMDGFRVLKAMREQGYLEKIPVFMVTSDNSYEFISKAYDFGVQDVIRKPFNPVVIRHRVSHAIELYNRRFETERLMTERATALEALAIKQKKNSMFLIDVLSLVVEFRDCESGQHIQSVRSVTEILLNRLNQDFPKMGFTSEEIEMIGTASMMHDIGKIAIPDYILAKPGKLTDHEYEIMKTHTLRGCEILDKINYIHDEKYYRYYYDICRWHHERWDGAGYPDGLRGRETPLWAQVVAVADCYEALVSERVYKPAYTHERAVEMIMGGECGAFSPTMLTVFQNAADGLKQFKVSVDDKRPTLFPEKKIDYVDQSTERRDIISERTLRLLEMERERYRVLSMLSHDVVFTYYPANSFLEVAEQFYTAFGINPDDKEGSLDIVRGGRIYDEDRESYLCGLGSLTQEQPTFKTELRIRVASGRYEWFKIYLYSFWDKTVSDGYVTLFGKITNINKQKNEILALRTQASTDALTKLFNRETFRILITQTIETEERVFALMMVDVDNFKRINDSMGHLYGDKILTDIGNIIRMRMRKTDYVARLGGDEFAIAMNDISGREAVSVKADEICSAIRTYKIAQNIPVDFSISIGIALYPQDGERYETLAKRADMALYTVKNEGKDDYRFYSQDLCEAPYMTVFSDIDERDAVTRATTPAV